MTRSDAEADAVLDAIALELPELVDFGGEGFERARIEIEQAHVEITALRVRALELELLRAEVVRERFADVAQRVIQCVRAVPARISRELAVVHDELSVEQIIAVELEHALRSLRPRAR